MAKAVDTGAGRREKDALRRPRSSIPRTQADVERELDVALLKAWMGMMESWALHRASGEVRLAFFDAAQALWAESKLTKQRPRLRRGAVPGIEALLQQGLAIEAEGWVEIPCVTEGWQAIEDHRRNGRKGGRKKGEQIAVPKLSLSSAKAQLSALEIIEVSRGTNGTALATRARPDSGIPEVRVRTSQRVRRKEAPVEGELFESKDTSTTTTSTSRFRATNLPGFDAFWAIYAVHKEKPNALKAWEELGCETRAAEIIAKVQLLNAEDDHWRRGFVKYPHRWLLAHGWEDDPIRAPKPQPSRAKERTERLKRWIATGSEEPMDDDVLDITPPGRSRHDH